MNSGFARKAVALLTDDGHVRIGFIGPSPAEAGFGMTRLRSIPNEFGIELRRAGKGGYGQTSAHEVTAMSFPLWGFVVERTRSEGHTPFGADRRREAASIRGGVPKATCPAEFLVRVTRQPRDSSRGHGQE